MSARDEKNGQITWYEPAAFSDIKRAGYADLSGRLRLLVGCALFEFAYLSWLFCHDQPDFKLTLGESMVLAALAAATFWCLPWIARGARCSAWIDLSARQQLAANGNPPLELLGTPTHVLAILRKRP